MYEQVLGSIDEATARHDNRDSIPLQSVEEADIRLALTFTAEGLEKKLLSKARVKHTSADPTVQSVWLNRSLEMK